MNQELVLTGNLTFDHSLAAVLESIAAQRNGGMSLLRLSELADNEQADKLVDGEILISNGKYVCAAIVRQKGRKRVISKGYPALRTLCAFAKADYEYVPAGTFRHELTLNIPITRIIELAPSLPEQSETLQNDNVFLDRIFGTMSKIASMQPIEPTQDPTADSAEDSEDEDDDCNVGPEILQQRSAIVDDALQRQRALAEASTAVGKEEPDKEIESDLPAKPDPPRPNSFSQIFNPSAGWLRRGYLVILIFIVLTAGLYQALCHLTDQCDKPSGKSEKQAKSHESPESGRQ